MTELRRRPKKLRDRLRFELETARIQAWERSTRPKPSGCRQVMPSATLSFLSLISTLYPYQYPSSMKGTLRICKPARSAPPGHCRKHWPATCHLPAKTAFSQPPTFTSHYSWATQARWLARLAVLPCCTRPFLNAATLLSADGQQPKYWASAAYYW